MDDDGDLLIDLNDTTDCPCMGIIYDSTQIIQSLLPNSSFEEYDSCPTTLSQMSYSSGWEQLSNPTSDYCNTCGYVDITNTCLPYPHGNGVVGMITSKDYYAPNWNYQEYVATCLTSPLLAGNQYTISFFVTAKVAATAPGCNTSINFGDIDLTIFGNSNCIFNLDTDNCPSSIPGGWQEVGAVNYSPTNQWSSVSFSFTPTFDIYGFALGSPCNLPASYNVGTLCGPYFVIDGVILSEYTEQIVSITTNVDLCNQSGFLIAHTDTTGGSWQWYFNGIALVGATNDTLNFDEFGKGAGSYTAIYTLPSGCYGTTYEISNKSLPTSIQNVTACSSYQWPVNNLIYTESGTFRETLSSANNCDSIVILNLEILPEQHFTKDTTICSSNHIVFFGDSINVSGTYQHILQNIYGCDSTIQLDLNVVEEYEPPIVFINLPNCPDDSISMGGNFPDESNVTWLGPNQEIWHSFILGTSSGNTGEYSVYYEMNGCLSKVSTIQIDEDIFPFLKPLIPNVITLNDDNQNDEIDFSEFVNDCDYDIMIMNRWGDVVFHQNNKPFDGLTQEGSKLSSGVYFFSLSIGDFSKEGFIQIIR